MIFAYGEVTTQRAVVDLTERLTGERCPLKAVTTRQVVAAIQTAELDLWPQVVLEYAYSSWARGDNDPRWAAFLGYQDVKALYPDIKVQTLEQTISDALAYPGTNPGFVSEEICVQISQVLDKWAK